MEVIAQHRCQVQLHKVETLHVSEEVEKVLRDKPVRPQEKLALSRAMRDYVNGAGRAYGGRSGHGTPLSGGRREQFPARSPEAQ